MVSESAFLPKSSKYNIHIIKSLKVKVLVTQSCPTLCNSIDCSLPGSSVHGILQARILEGVANSFSRGPSWPRIEPRSPTLQADSLLSEPQYKPISPCPPSIYTNSQTSLLEKSPSLPITWGQHPHLFPHLKDSTGGVMELWITLYSSSF